VPNKPMFPSSIRKSIYSIDNLKYESDYLTRMHSSMTAMNKSENSLSLDARNLKKAVKSE